MTQVIRLIAIDGTLYFPHGGLNESLEHSHDEPSILIYEYAAGDCDTVPWPLVPREFVSETVESLNERLASALFDERECNEFFPVDAVIELPDGTRFSF